MIPIEMKQFYIEQKKQAKITDLISYYYAIFYIDNYVVFFLLACHYHA